MCNPVTNVAGNLIRIIFNNLFTRFEVCVMAVGGNLQHLFQHALSDYIKHYMRECKTTRLAVRVGSVLNQTPCR